MKTNVLLVLSLALNVALGALTVWLFLKPRPEPFAPAAPTASGPSVASVEARPSAAAEAAAARPAQPFDWRMVESADYKQYIANLRAIGCPEETIRDIIIADVNKLFASRRESLHTSTNRFEYWKAGNFFSAMFDPERIEKEQALAREKRELLKELLGSVPEEKLDLFAGFNPLERLLDFLPAQKQTAVFEVFQKMQAQMMRGFRGGAPDGEDLGRMQRAQKEMEAELAKILTPQELEEYQLRLSPTAMAMRMQLASFEPTEQEFRQIFALRKKFDDQFNPMAIASMDEAERERMNSARRDMEQQLKNILGDARYAEYERSQDWAYQSIYRVTQRQGLPRDAAVKVYEMKKVAEDQAQRVRRDETLTPEQRQAALQGIRNETEGAIRTVLGERGFDAYQRQPGAAWLRNLAPTPATPGR
ncbi:MAG: hypothetical protein N3I86_06120 [Verrucomicrobiae bacterium]|nr:hypothetical protein [Verrucomicrobiae bacterium]MDW8309712.1 hypothetical protein [Verrucomicrobiales bacterium]